MQCQYCHFTFKVAGNYRWHLRAQHPDRDPNESLAFQESLVATNSKRHSKRPRTSSTTIAKSVKHWKVSVSARNTHNDTKNIQEDVSGPGKPEPAHYLLPSEFEAGKVLKTSIFKSIRSPQYNPLAPFQNMYEYKLAWLFHQSKTSLQDINNFFKNGLLPGNLPETTSVSFKSGYMWRKKMQ
jgi:hypothetical protein